jgi:hypothetical protein
MKHWPVWEAEAAAKAQILSKITSPDVFAKLLL